LATNVINDFRTLLFRKIKDVFIDQALFQELSRFFSSFMPTDSPCNGFSKIFIKERIQIEKKTFFIG
jgi:hypothetical protein